MRICYFGTYTNQEGYPMNEVLIRGLQDNGVEIIECHETLWQGRMEKVESTQKGLIPLLGLFLRYCRAYLSLTIRFFRMEPFDAIIVGYPGHLDFFLAKALNIFRGRKPILINLLFSLHDTMVNDRKLFPADSLRARLLWRIDRRIGCWADRIILDTGAHIDFFHNEFAIPKEKFIRIPIGADDTFFRPQKQSKDISARSEFQILFFGTYIPLHGIETILRAAYELKSRTDIRFTLIGSGQSYEEMHTLAKTLDLTQVTFVSSWVSYSDLARYIQGADICLGIFGTTEKAGRVIPCKIYNCLAMGKPLITADTPAAREILVGGVHAVLTPPGDSHALAKAILNLKNNPSMRTEMEKAAYLLFRTSLSPKQIGHEIQERLKEMRKGLERWSQ